MPASRCFRGMSFQAVVGPAVCCSYLTCKRTNQGGCTHGPCIVQMVAWSRERWHHQSKQYFCSLCCPQIQRSTHCKIHSVAQNYIIYTFQNSLLDCFVPYRKLTWKTPKVSAWPQTQFWDPRHIRVLL